MKAKSSTGREVKAKATPKAKDLTAEEVIDRAKKWARLHRNVTTRARMDECLEGISTADQRRVYLCGQRIVGGLSIKVVPSANEQKGEEEHGTTNSNSGAKNRKGR